jgi:hypothetical protein
MDGDTLLRLRPPHLLLTSEDCLQVFLLVFAELFLPTFRFLLFMMAAVLCL